MWPSRKYQLTLAGLVLLVVALLAAWMVLLWAQLTPAERQALVEILARRPAYPFVLLFLLLVGIGMALRHFFRAYPEALRRLAGQTRLIVAANPGHRIAPGGAAEVRELIEAINVLAERQHSLLAEIEAQVRAAQAELEEEKNLLAALISELAEGVVVCNADGRILLYNQRARYLLQAEGQEGAGPAEGLVGLGRSLYRVLDPAPIQRALEGLGQHGELAGPHRVSRFLTATRSGRRLRVHLLPLHDPRRGGTGFVLTLDDVTREIESDQQRDALLQSLTGQVRAALARLHTALETFSPARAAGGDSPGALEDAIRREMETLGSHIEETLAEHAGRLRPWWSLPEMARDELSRTRPIESPVVHIGSGARPEFYDFDLLFTRAGAHPELERRPLEELAYTVLDTETTGLDPSAGDEIIALGAVRMVNGRLLRGEIFDQRIDPQRPVSPEALAIHGISAEMLRDEPPIAQVLPRFHAFVADTVLVAHNAAFDMRFLQLKEAAAGVRFDQPVLDTLLLSAAVHPEQRHHSLEAVAQRLGIPVVDRHTALGDALLTGQVFLKLLPLLAACGITTLGAALDASRRTMLARVRY